MEIKCLDFRENIGKRVMKITRKPFKSRLQINTVKDVINHPGLNIPAYLFEEDDSMVEARRCSLNLNVEPSEPLKRKNSNLVKRNNKTISVKKLTNMVKLFESKIDATIMTIEFSTSTIIDTDNRRYFVDLARNEVHISYPDPDY